MLGRAHFHHVRSQLSEGAGVLPDGALQREHADLRLTAHLGAPRGTSGAFYGRAGTGPPDEDEARMRNRRGALPRFGAPASPPITANPLRPRTSAAQVVPTLLSGDVASVGYQPRSASFTSSVAISSPRIAGPRPRLTLATIDASW